jgi:hypothetical protein
MAWAERNGWDLAFDLDQLALRASAKHPHDDTPLFLTADFSSYRALPPAWRFVNEHGVEEKLAYPAPGPLPEGRASIFHTQPVICAPFNRLAFKNPEKDGPHAGDWGDAARWTRVPGAFARAHTIADMLMIIDTHLSYSKGRQ